MNPTDLTPPSYRTLNGVLLGTAVGDALGLPAENLSPQRIRRLWKGEWRMRLLPGHGMISDDTEHTLMAAQALLSHPDDAAAFQRSLAWKFRWWFASLPGGIGLATAKACLKLWLGFPANKAAVKSAGSGPAMRSAIIGTYFANDPERRREFVLASSRLTHRGWQAETAALAVAECAALAVRMQNQPEPPPGFRSAPRVERGSRMEEMDVSNRIIARDEQKRGGIRARRRIGQGCHRLLASCCGSRSFFLVALPSRFPRRDDRHTRMRW